MLVLLVTAWLPARGAEPDTKKAKEIEDKIYEELLQKASYQIEGGGPAIYVQEVQKRRLILPLMMWCDEKGRIQKVLWAKEATFTVPAKERVLQLHVIDGNFTHSDGTRAWFADRWFDIPLPTPKEAPEKSRSDGEGSVECLYGTDSPRP
jgi:hypothetical protein